MAKAAYATRYTGHARFTFSMRARSARSVVSGAAATETRSVSICVGVHIHVVLAADLLERRRLQRPVCAVAGVVQECVDAAELCETGNDGGVDRWRVLEHCE